MSSGEMSSTVADSFSPGQDFLAIFRIETGAIGAEVKAASCRMRTKETQGQKDWNKDTMLQESYQSKIVKADNEQLYQREML